MEKMFTTRSNIDRFRRDIPLESFPLTFRHAIEVTRSLGVRYLWIDSLCIVQDDVGDWEEEAGRMGYIYDNSYATIFAERAAHCHAGLFQTPEDKSAAADWIHETSYLNPLTG